MADSWPQMPRGATRSVRSATQLAILGGRRGPAEGGQGPWWHQYPAPPRVRPPGGIVPRLTYRDDVIRRQASSYAPNVRQRDSARPNGGLKASTAVRPAFRARASAPCREPAPLVEAAKAGSFPPAQ